KVVLEIPNPLSTISTKMETAGANALLGKQLNFFLKAAALIEEKNREKPFILFGNQVKGKVARWLTSASEIEAQDCHKKYLQALAENIRERGRFSVDLPPWVSLELNPIEIVFPRADRYSAAILVLKTFFNLPTGTHYWGKGHFFDAFVYVNIPDDTLEFKEYSRVFSLMQDHLYALPVLSRSRQDISYSPVPPTFKISQLVFSSQPEIRGVALVYPNIDDKTLDPAAEKFKNEGDDNFKIVVFKNLVESYFEGVLKPISASVLPGEQVWNLDADIYISNLIMRRIAHHLGPVFVIAPKEQDGRGTDEKKQQRQVQKGKAEMELKTIPELLGDLFPVVEAIKSQAVALYNTPVLINNGLLPDDKAKTVYLIYLVTLIDRLRNTPAELTGPQQPGRKNWEDLLGDPNNENYLADLIQFNYLLGKESILLNIGNRTLDIDRVKFEAAVGELAGEVVRIMTYPNYDSARWFIEKNSALSPQLSEILKSAAGIPSHVEFRMEKPKVIEVEELEETKQ
ncbi:MAG: hypothetical protein QG657_248, partial [Acidobacteriota bacterium]|nr:hypothetical protein [Acidobacteriota bacterium]